MNTQQNLPVPISRFLDASGNVTPEWYRFFLTLYLQLTAGPVVPVTLGASPATYTATAKGNLLLSGGTVTGVAFTRDGTTMLDAGQTQGFFPMARGDAV